MKRRIPLVSAPLIFFYLIIVANIIGCLGEKNCLIFYGTLRNVFHNLRLVSFYGWMHCIAVPSICLTAFHFSPLQGGGGSVEGGWGRVPVRSRMRMDFSLSGLPFLVLTMAMHLHQMPCRLDVASPHTPPHLPPRALPMLPLLFQWHPQTGSIIVGIVMAFG